MKRTRLRPVSKKRAALNVEYRKLRKAFLLEHQVCEFSGCRSHSRDVHHRSGRGPNLLRVETWLALCRKHHDLVHANPKKSRELGLLT